MRLLGFVAGLLPALCGAAYADSPAPEPAPAAPASIQFESGGDWSNLTNNYGEWHSVYATGEWKKGQRDIYGAATLATRNGITDPIYSAGASFPASSRSFVEFDANFSPTHIYAPIGTVAGVLDSRLAKGWGFQLGEAHRTYPALASDVGSLGVDRYFGHYRANYVFSVVGLSNVDGLSVNQRLGLTRYYGRDDENRTGLVVYGGRDVENVNGTPAVYPIFGLDLSGRHWFDAHYGLSYEIYSYRQGNLYHRSGMQVGLRYRS
jgi:YaiO family outer membrane protein